MDEKDYDKENDANRIVDTENKNASMKKKKIVGPDKKIKGKYYARKGQIQKFKGRLEHATGTGIHAAGTSIRGAAMAYRASAHALATLLDLAYGAGERLRPAIEKTYRKIDGAGKSIQKRGNIHKKIGNERIKQGEHLKKRGKILSETGKDIGKKDSPVPEIQGKINKPKIPTIGNLLKKGINKIIKRWLLFLLIPLIFIIALVIFMILEGSIKKKSATYKEGDYSNVPFVVDEMAINKIEIIPDGSGGYTYGFASENGSILSLDEVADNILNTLKKNKSKSISYLGKDNNQQKDLLKKMIKAEIVTQYPDLSNSVQIGSFSGGGAGDYIVNTALPNAAPVLNENQLRQAVERSTISEQGKQNVLSIMKDIVRLQDEYKINALFLIAAARIESGCGVGWDLIDPNTHNWLSVKGRVNGGYIDRNGTSWNTFSSYAEATESWFKLISQNYFTAGNCSVKTIAPIYCNDKWGNSVSGFMDEFYGLVGISVSENTDKNKNENENNNEETDNNPESDEENTDQSAENEEEKSDEVSKNDEENTNDEGSEVRDNNTSAEDKTNGNIKIKRKNQSGEEQRLSYVEESVFNNMISNKDPNVMNYYTLKKNSYSATGGSPSTLTGSDNEEKIWNYLIDSGCTEEGAAGLMGNLKNESGFRSKAVFNDYTHADCEAYDDAYIAKVDNGEMSREEFANVNVLAFGLAQWYSSGRREKLYDYAKSQGKSIGDLQMQLEFLVAELKESYSDIWSMMTTSNDVRAVCDIVLRKFEAPGSEDEKIDRRSKDAYEVYDNHKGTHVAGSTLGGDGSVSDFSSFDNFLFIGDSRYVGIESGLKKLGNNVSVCAVSNSTAKDWIGPTQNKNGSVLGKSITLPDSVSGVSVMLGANRSAYSEELKQVLENLHSLYPNVMIYYNSTFHVGTNYTSYNKDSTNAGYDQLNGKIRDFSNSNPWLQYIDITEGLHDSNGYLISSYSTDGLHLTSSEGREILVSNIKNCISNGIVSSGSVPTSSGIAKRGQKDSNGVNITEGGNIDFLNCAIDAHMLVNEEKFVYGQGRYLPVVRNDSVRYIDCSAYVSMCLEEYGLTDWNTYPAQMDVPQISEYAEGKNFEITYDGSTMNIADMPNLQSGDIVVMGRKHTQIFYGYDDNGNAVWLSCGQTPCIQEKEGTCHSWSKNITRAYRVTEGLGSYRGTRSGSESSGSSQSKYMLVVANKTETTTRKTISYEYSGTDIISTGSGTTTKGTQFSDSPAEDVSESTTYSFNTTSLDYQAAMKDYTMYFDFLWATCVISGNRMYINDFSDLILNSDIEITIYSEEQVSQNSSTGVAQSVHRYNKEESTVYVDHYSGTETTTIITKKIASKGGVTYADLWNLIYKNEANTYKEFKSKSMQKFREKTSKGEDGEEDQFVKIIKIGDRLKSSYTSLYRIEEAVNENEKVKHIYPIYEYMIRKIYGARTEHSSLKELLNLDAMDLSANEKTASTVQVLLYTSLNISENDRKLLGQAVDAICGSSCEETRRKKAVVSVILNRVLSNQFPNTIEAVLSEPGQFQNLNYADLANIIPSDDTMDAVEAVTIGGDAARKSVYFGTPAVATSMDWDNTMKFVFNDGDKEADSFSYYTTDEISEELKKYEVSVEAGTTVPTSKAKAIVKWAKEQVGKKSFFDKTQNKNVESKNYSAAFVSSAYAEGGLEYLACNAIDMPCEKEIKYNSDGSVDCSKIPIGAIIVSEGVSAEGNSPGHVALYIGDGYVIEAGGDKIVKTPIDQSYGATTAKPFVKWGYAAEDQKAAQEKLVISIGRGSGSYGEGWTPFDDWATTGIQGVFTNGEKSFNIFLQCHGPWAGRTYWEGTSATDACGACSVGIILTGYGFEVDAAQAMWECEDAAGLAHEQKHAHGCALANMDNKAKVLSKYGIDNTVGYKDREKMKQYLSEGKPLICGVAGFYGPRPTAGHYITLLGYDEATDKAFIGDPATNSSGWFDFEVVYGAMGSVTYTEM